MNTEKINTLEKVQDAMDIVENARAVTGLTPDEKTKLEAASTKLRNLERTIIRIKTTELVASLTSDSEALKILAGQIKESSEKLSGVANAIEKAACIAETFIKIISTAFAAGLL
jgi:uncharacterized protein Yka (UPF0111/DUF47 family)